MNKKCLKCIMELIFIFILPLLIIIASVSITTEKTYDENNNELTEIKTIQFQNQLYSEGSGNWFNRITIKELVKNNNYWYSQNKIFTEWTITGYQATAFMNNNVNQGQLYLNNSTSTGRLEQKLENLINGHKYLLNVVYLKESGTIPRLAIQGLFTGSLQLSSSSKAEIHNFYTYEGSYANNNYCTIYTNDNSTGSRLYLWTIELMDLTSMFGSGYEPTTWNDYCLYTNINSITYKNDETNYINYNRNGEIIEYTSNSQISANAEPDLTTWGKIKQLLINNLYLTDNVILNIVLCYTVLWFIMFILWHCFYLFFDMLIHLFIDWGHKEKEKVK